MYKRDIETYLRVIGSKYPVITLVGPRQSGKSTLSRLLYPDYSYVSLETPDHRQLAQEDPRGFFKRFPTPAVIDEVQKVPELLSYIQTIVDAPGFESQFVLTGSHQLLLMEKITQSLAGRTTIAKLLPFSLAELKKGPTPKNRLDNIDTLLFTGGYPRIYDKNLGPSQWMEQYFQTYVERDVRTLLNVDQIDLFDRFIRLCAGRVGQLANFSSLANDCGISPPTARAWLSVLQASFVCFYLQPYFKNFSKRIIKSPKIYFYDTGLLCYLLKIQNVDQLAIHPLRGSVFENWVITEKMKSYFNKGKDPSLYFWRDTKGNEIDIVVDEGNHLQLIEVKAAYSFDTHMLKNIDFFSALQKKKARAMSLSKECIYTGDDSFDVHQAHVRSWKNMG